MTMIARAGRVLVRLYPTATYTVKHRVASIAIPTVCQRVSAAYSTEASVSPSQPVQVDIAIPAPQRAHKSKPVSRPKAHTGRTTSSPRKTKPKTVTKTTEGLPDTAAKKVAKPRAKASPKPKATKKTKVKKPKAKEPAAKEPKVKPAPKRRGRKALTEEQKSAAAAKAKREQIKELKKTALKPPKGLMTTAFQVVLAEQIKEGKTDLPTSAKIASEKYKNLIPEELEHYNHIANTNKAKGEEALREWIKSYTPEEIHKAHNAHKKMARLGIKRRFKTDLLGHDDRQIRRPLSNFIHFSRDRMASGDYKGMATTEKVRLIAHEWKELDNAEKQKYQDAFIQDRERYLQEKAAAAA
ncbi:MAG: hypothetical protein Q9187_001709 [Circinaria calcarea]